MMLLSPLFPCPHVVKIGFWPILPLASGDWGRPLHPGAASVLGPLRVWSGPGELVQSGKKVMVSDRAAWVGSESRARAVAHPRSEAESVEAARVRHAAFLQATRLPHAVGQLFTASVFLSLWAVFRYPEVRTQWPWLAIAGVGGWLLLVGLTVRLHRRFYPAAKEERFTVAIMLLASPLLLARIRQLLAADLMVAFHPLVAAAVLLPRAEFEALAGWLLRRLAHPAHEDPPAPNYSAAFIESERARARDLVRALGWREDALVAAPLPEGQATRYCPRCHAQFVDARERCSECRDVQLLEFWSSRTEAEHPS